MAAKKSTKATKKPAKKPPAKVAKPKKRAKAAPKVLTADERARLLRPHDDFRELVANTIEVWTSTGKALRVANRAPSQLKRALSVAIKASEKEEKLRREFEAKLAHVADARLVAQHDVWSMLLDVYATVRGLRSAPELQQAYAFLGAAFARLGRKPAEPAPADPE